MDIELRYWREIIFLSCSGARNAHAAADCLVRSERTLVRQQNIRAFFAELA